ncbi:MAG: Fic family protein [Pseudonocardia sp.]
MFGKLARANHLRELDRGDFLDGLAEAVGDVNAVHPFREGNGRTQRAFFSQLARDAGHPLDWQHLDAEQNLVASQASLRGELAPLRSLLDHHVAPVVTETSTETPDLPAQRRGHRPGPLSWPSRCDAARQARVAGRGTSAGGVIEKDVVNLFGGLRGAGEPGPSRCAWMSGLGGRLRACRGVGRSERQETRRGIKRGANRGGPVVPRTPGNADRVAIAAGRGRARCFRLPS